MRLLYILCALTLVSISDIYAQRFVRQNPFPVLSELEDIYMNDAGFGWAVGSEGVILYTEDDGENWAIQESPMPDRDNSSVAYVPGTNGQVAYVGSKALLKTENAGASWDIVFDIPGQAILKVYVFSPTDFVVIASRFIYVSSDGGENWDERMGPEFSTQKVSFLDQNNGWILEPGGNIYYTSDAAQSWTLVNNRSAFNSSIGAFSFYTRDKGYVLSNGGVFYETADQGVSWDSISTIPNSASWEDIFTVDGVNLYAMGTWLMHKSSDGGRTWDRVQSAIDPPMSNHGEIFIRDNDLFMVGNLSTILYSDDNTASWTDLIAGEKGQIRDASGYSDTHLSVACDAGMLYTINGGALWSVKALPNDNRGYGVHMIDEQRIVMGTTNGIFTTTDAGDTWSQTLPGRLTVTEITQTQSGRLIAGESRTSIIYGSDDMGATWDMLFDPDPEASSQITDIEIIGNIIYVSGYRGLLLKSVDGGDNWTILNVPDGDAVNLTEVQFFSETQGLIRAIGDYLYETEDGGVTWSAVGVDDSFLGYNFHFDDRMNGYATGGRQSQGIVYKTVDGGVTWDPIHEVGTFYTHLLRPSTGDQSLLWVFGQGGNIELFAPCADDPSIDNLQVKESYCAGDTVILSISFENAVEFFWEIPDGWFIEGNSNSSAITCIVGDEGGRISVQAGNTCVLSQTLISDVEVSTSPESVDISTDGIDLMTNTAGDQYQWYFNNLEINGATNSTYTASDEGNYRVGVINGSCNEVLSEELFVTLTSNRTVNDFSLAYWPNPATDYIYLSTQSQSHLLLQLRDIDGTLLMEKETRAHDEIINISGYSPGVYLLSIIGERQTSVIKIYKQ